jgi:predicted nucleic acid-binding protein
MHVADSSVLVYGFDTAAPEHEQCRARLAAWTSLPTPWYPTWGIVYEFLRTPRRYDAGWSFVDALLSAPPTSILVAGDRNRSVLAQSLAEVPSTRGNRVHDLQAAAPRQVVEARTLPPPPDGSAAGVLPPSGGDTPLSQR